MSSIKRVTIKGDLIEIEKEEEGHLKIVRRNVQGYDKFNKIKQRKIIHDIAGLPFIEPFKLPAKKNILTRLHLKK